MTAIHQVIGVYAERDAVGGHTVALRDALRARHFTSEIFADERPNGSASTALATPELDRRADDGDTILVYQASAYAKAAKIVARRTEPLVVNYHNVTPPQFFSRWEPSIARLLQGAREQVRNLAPRAVLAVADSRFNATELADFGYRRIEVVPVLIDTDRLGRGAASPWPARPGTRWLFVGRIAPNKAQHEVVKAFKLYRDCYDPRAVLALPGASSSHRYQEALDDFIRVLGLDDVVLRPGSVPDAELGAYYENADAFVCLSEHEGFCNTVIEAMALGLPVIARSSSALPATVADAGLVLSPFASAQAVADAVHLVVTDRRVGTTLVDAGRARHRDLTMSSAGDRFCDVLAELAQR
ncbi:MAG TPA: glycosyltransferase [Acidimicrobiia bacterium]|nr:glycosyltransferase [Acidimicrobiia bacterium]